MDVLKALADENRVRLLGVLQGRELCVCQLVELLALAPSTVSKHLSILKTARLVESRKNGRWIYYRLSKTRSPAMARVITAILQALRNSWQFQEDGKKVKKIVEMDAEELCRKIMGRN